MNKPEDNASKKEREDISPEKTDAPASREGRVITSVPGIKPQNRSAVKRAQASFDLDAEAKVKAKTAPEGENQPRAKMAIKPRQDLVAPAREKAEPAPPVAAAPAPVEIAPPVAQVEAEEALPMRPPKPGEAAAFVPVPYVRKEGDPPPLVPRRRKKNKPRYRRLMRIGVWRARRRVAREHARYSLRTVAAFYLGLLAVAAVLIGGYAIRHTPSPVIGQPVVLPEDKLVQKLLADTSFLMNQKKYDEAWKKVQRLLELQPGNVNVYLMAGAIQATKKDYPKAREAFGKAQSLSPVAFAPAFNLAEMEFTAGNYEEADRLFRELRKKFSPNRLVLFRIYLCALKLGHPEDAVVFLNHPDIDPQSPEWFYIHGLDALQNGRKGEGRRTLDTARSLFGKTAEPYDQTLERIGLIK